jgi:hypothetical protein
MGHIILLNRVIGNDFHGNGFRDHESGFRVFHFLLVALVALVYSSLVPLVHLDRGVVRGYDFYVYVRVFHFLLVALVYSSLVPLVRLNRELALGLYFRHPQLVDVMVLMFLIH